MAAPRRPLIDHTRLRDIVSKLDDMEEQADEIVDTARTMSSEGEAAARQDKLMPEEIRRLREMVEKVEAADSPLPPGRLFSIGRTSYGWEDVILALVLVVIIVSWIQGVMDFQAVLVALMGTGAGGAWGAVTGRSHAQAGSS